MRRTLYFVTSIAVVSLLNTLLPYAIAETNRAEVEPAHRRSVVYATHGMAAAAHPLAVEIGIDVLQKGGSAVDAAIAVNAALGVLEPMMCGIGGDLFAVVWDAKTQQLYGLNANGPAPMSLTIAQITPDKDGEIKPRSVEAWSVPGCVDGWAKLHQRFGKLPLSELLEPAIKLAREGAPVPRIIASEWESGASLKDMPGFAEVFLPNGRPPREGELFRNPALADSYEQIAQQGADAFYKGPIADAIDAFSHAHNGFLRKSDLAAFSSEWVQPISTTYRGVEVFELPPMGQGLAALQMLNILENFDLRKMGRDSPEFWHTMVEAKKLAFADRAHFYADPKFADIPLKWLLSKEYAKERAKRIDPRHAALTDVPGDPKLEHGDTTYLCTADREGNMVSLIQSNYYAFGSGYVVGGFALQNRGQLFNLDPKHPNALEPGKRPFHTIIPAFAMKDGKPWLAFGVMGGSMQPQGHVQILVNLIDFDMDLQQAGDAARFRHLGSSQPNGKTMTDGGRLRIEPWVSEAVLAGLRERGHHLDGSGGSFGGYQAIARDPETGVYFGATESRKDGCVMGH